MLNLSSISEDLGISQNTVKSLISILVSSYIIFLVKPYRKKYGKQLVKTPKLFFVDTDVACSLLGIKNATELKQSYLRGSLVETLVVSDMNKQLCNKDFDPSKTLYFWRDHSGHEIDAVLHKQAHPRVLKLNRAQQYHQISLRGLKNGIRLPKRLLPQILSFRVAKIIKRGRMELYLAGSHVAPLLIKYFKG